MILGPITKTRTSNKYVVVVTDRYSELTRASPSKTTTATDVAHISINYWVTKYGVEEWLLLDNGPQFAEKFFDAACAALETKLMSTTAYHPQTNGQFERYNMTVVSCLRHYIGEHQDDRTRLSNPLATPTLRRLIQKHIRLYVVSH